MHCSKEMLAELRRLTRVWRPSADTVRELADAVSLLLEDVEELMETVTTRETEGWRRSPWQHNGCGGDVECRIDFVRGTQEHHAWAQSRCV